MRIYRNQPKVKRVQRTWKETRKGIDRRVIRQFVIAAATIAATACTVMGPSDYVCKTQPRTYCNTSQCWQEVDHYTQTNPCPRNPDRVR